MNKKQILLIDDEPQILKTVKRYLEAEDYEILTANNGAQGLDIFLKENPPLVITDIRMPGISGIEVLKEIKGKKESDTEVIVISGHGDMDTSIEALRLEASDFISKPVDMEHLYLAVSRAFDKIRIKSRLREYTKDLQGSVEKKTKEIKEAHAMLLQSEKLASIGQLAAGVAHEINNPAGFVSSNLNTLEGYFHDIVKVMMRYEEIHIAKKEERTSLLEEIKQLEEDLDIEYIMQDIDELIEESKDGVNRIRDIVVNLKDFSRLDHGDKEFFDLNKGIESTLKIIWNELKYKADITKSYGKIPEIEGFPREINQVFMNLLVNAAQAIEKRGRIDITTGLISSDKGQDLVEVRISDTGAGIKKENLGKIFDPFFTTKDVGKGTGLGLNISYKVIEKHHGEISAESEVGKGTTFVVKLPLSLRSCPEIS